MRWSSFIQLYISHPPDVIHVLHGKYPIEAAQFCQHAQYYCVVNEKIINEICQLKLGAQTCYKK